MFDIFDIAKRLLAICFIILILLGNLWISLAIFGQKPSGWIIDAMRIAAFFAIFNGCIYFFAKLSGKVKN